MSIKKIVIPPSATEAIDFLQSLSKKKEEMRTTMSKNLPLNINNKSKKRHNK